MLMQKNLIDIALTLAHYLRDDENVKDFCQAQFKKDMTYYVGELLRKSIPVNDNAPYIVICELAKTEGTNDTVQYSCTMFVGIVVDENAIVTESTDILMYDGVDVLANLLNLVQVELNKRSNYQRPISIVKTSILGAIDPTGKHWVGTMELKWNMQQTINLSVEEEF